MGRLGSSWLGPGSIPRVGAVSGARFPKILCSFSIASGMGGFRREMGWVSAGSLSRGRLGCCPGGTVAFPFPAPLSFGDRSGGVTQFFELLLSPLREFQLLLLQVVICLLDHIPVVLEFLGGGRGVREASDLLLDAI